MHLFYRILEMNFLRMFASKYIISSGKKRDRIKRHILIGTIEQGGIGIIDIDSKFKAAKASWISRIIDESSLIHRFITQLLKKHDTYINI